MTLRIEAHNDGERLTIRLTGRMKEDCLEALKALLDSEKPGVVVNLGDVSLVGVEVVRFLAHCEAAGVELVDCSPYIRDWINRERDKTT